jgi:YVTN family beta-propeller protein
VTVIDGTTDTVVLPSIGTGSSPYAAAYDRTNGHLFVVNYGSDNLTVLNGTSNSVGDPSIGVGNGPIDVAYDPVNGYLYVTNYGDPIDGSPGDNVTVINANGRLVSSWEAAYTVTFTETGLPIGTAWSVQATADAGPSWSANSMGTTASLALPAGTYTYTISAAGYRMVTETDQIVRGNSGLTVAVALTPMNPPPFPWIGGIVGAAVVVMVSAAIVVLLRRERSPPRNA